MEAKKWFMSRMFWLGVATVVGGIAEFISELPTTASTLTVVGGLLTIILRFATNQPVSK